MSTLSTHVLDTAAGRPAPHEPRAHQGTQHESEDEGEQQAEDLHAPTLAGRRDTLGGGAPSSWWAAQPKSGLGPLATTCGSPSTRAAMPAAATPGR